MLRFLPKNPARLLEIGCGEGRFLEQIKAGETWGVEPNVKAANIAAPKCDRFFNATYASIEGELPDGAFDLVVANDVIEHMPDHDWFFQSIRRKIALGGVIVGSLPNVLHVTAVAKLLVLKDWPYRDQGILDRTHLRFFTRKSIARSLTSNGFAIEALEGCNGVLRHGFDGMSRRNDWLGRVVTAGVIALSLGYYFEAQYPQFGFRARPAAA